MKEPAKLQRTKRRTGTDLQLPIAFRPGRGGKRSGAGRKSRSTGSCVPHRARQRLAARYPVHITMKLRRELGSLRTKRKVAVIRRSAAAARARFGARIVHWSVQRDHIHAIVEAKNASALARAVQGFSIRVAKGLNRLLGRRGAAFADRYHVHILKTPREVRNALAYVLNNARRHAAKCGQYVAGTFVDPFSTWALFDGWIDAPARPPPDANSAASPPRTWLLRIGWQRHGLLSIREVPGTT